jgi:hypothetical protein
MTDQKIRGLAEQFRAAIEAAHDDGRFSTDISFKNFPRACCGDASYLLAEYLREFGIETIWYSTRRGEWAHAWLVVKDERVKKPTPKSFSWPEELHSVLAGYGVQNPEKEVDITRYEEDDLHKGLIIDITADQFDDYDISVYVGYQDSFHQSFDFAEAHDYDGLNDGRLYSLYRTIKGYL